MPMFEVLGEQPRAATFRRRALDLQRGGSTFAARRMRLRGRRAGLRRGPAGLAEAIDVCVRRSLRLRPVVRSIDWMRQQRGLWRLALRLRPLVLGDSPQ
jgi:hypothetical protein